MPKLIPEKEKTRIIKRHKELVDELNAFIADKKEHIAVDKKFAAHLDDPEVVESYNLAKEMREIKEKQSEILDDYANDNPLHNGSDRRWLACAIKVEDTPAAREYNEKLFKDYQESPDKVKAMLFRKVMTFDPRKIMECGDNKTELLQFYKNNHEVVDLADVLANSSGSSIYNNQNPDFTKAVEDMSEPLSVIAYPKHLAEDALTDDFYAMPEVNEKQAKTIVIASDEEEKDEFSKYVRDNLESVAGNDLTTKPNAYFRAVAKAHPLPTDKNFLSTFVAMQENHNDEPSVADFSDVINDPEHNDVFQRQEVESFNIRSVNKEFSKEYQNSWMKAFNKKNKFEEGQAMATTLNKNKGGFWEKMFKTTSKEYKEYEQALEDYHNPESPNYLNDKNLRLKSNAYLDHKRDKDGDLDLSKMDETSKNRVNLVNNTLQILDKTDSIEKNAENAINEGYPAIEKSFLVEEDVSEMSYEEEESLIRRSSEMSNESLIDEDELEM